MKLSVVSEAQSFVTGLILLIAIVRHLAVRADDGHHFLAQ